MYETESICRRIKYRALLYSGVFVLCQIHSMTAGFLSNSSCSTTYIHVDLTTDNESTIHQTPSRYPIAAAMIGRDREYQEDRT